MTNQLRAALAGLALLIAAPVAAADPVETPDAQAGDAAEARAALRAEQAQALLDYEIGLWDSRWERLDAEGNVTVSFTGTEHFEWYLGDKVVQLTTRIPELDQMSKSLRFFSPREQRIVFWAVDSNSDHWTMHQDVESGIIHSLPTPTAAGGEMTLRFTTTRKTADAFDVAMDYSLDGGDSWVRGMRQYLTRAASPGQP